jgi:hypothetical protein
VIEFLHAKHQPWSAKPCGLPTNPPLPSMKYKAWSQGTFSTSSNGLSAGFGFIASRSAWVSDDWALTMSQADNRGSTVSTTALASQVTLSNHLNAPFATAAYTGAASGIESRLVGSGIRIRYIGTELNKGGVIIPFEHPQHETMVGMSADDALAYPNVHPIQVDRGWHTIVWNAVTATDERFQPTIYPYDPTDIHGGPTIGLMAVGPSDGAGGYVPLEFQYESYVIVETTGRQASVFGTPSIAAPQKHATVKNITGSAPQAAQQKMSKLPVKRLEQVGLKALATEDPGLAPAIKVGGPILETGTQELLSLL